MPTVSQRFVSHRAGAASGRALDPSAPVVLMVSGGADSTALLVMACTSKLDIMDGRGPARIARERIHVLHVNHHLRGEASDADEEHVRGLCERYGVPLCVEHASFTELNGQNLEAAAREVRYAAARRYVRELCQEAGCPRTAARIVTAHTASDRAETFFMNAIKGAGPAGLSSIPRRRNIIVRPLIDLTHEELCRYLEVAGIAWREDESNQDTSYLRNYVRHRVIPVARERNENLARNVGAACDILGDEDAFMAHLAATALRSCTRRQQEGLVVLDAARVAASSPASGSVAYVDAAALGYAERDLVRLKESGSSLPAESLGARLWVDAPAPGDLLCPLGMHGRSKKLSDLLGEEQVPVAERPLVPVVRTAPGGSVVWVGGIRLDDRFKCTAASKVLVKLVIHPQDLAL